MRRFISRHRRALAAGVVLVFAGAAFLEYQAVSAARTPAAVRYVTQTAQRQSVIASVSGTGNMSVASTYDVSSPVSGTVEKVAVKLGDTVKKGQTLFVVGDDEVESSIKSALVSYNQAQAAVINAKVGKYQAAQKLSQVEAQAEAATPTATATDVEVAEAQFTAAKLSLTAAEDQEDTALQSYEEAVADRDKRTVTAPATGVVTTLDVAAGDIVTGGSTGTTSAGSQSGGTSTGGTSTGTSSAASSSSSTTGSASSSAAVVISDVSSQRAVVTLNETDIALVKTGLKVNLTFDALTDLNLTGKVELIGSEGTVSSGVVTYEVTIAPDSLDSRVRPGMTVSSVIVTKTRLNAIAVPSTAIKTQTDGTTYVQVLANKVPQNKTVVTGLVGDSVTEIVSGLSAGDKVITRTVSSDSSTTSTTKSSSNGLGILGGAAGGSGGPPAGGPPAGGGQ